MDWKKQYGPWALIAGGSDGVGAAFARKLAGKGINLVLVARSRETLDEVAQQAREESHVEVRTLQVDLSGEDALAQVRAMTDPLEIGLVIYNAGAQRHVAEFLDEPIDSLLKLVRLNSIGHLLFCHHFGTQMRARRRGGIILIGAGAGYTGVPGLSVYSAVKAFSRLLAEALWFELKPHNVQVLELILGNTRTPGAAKSGFDFDKYKAAVAEPEDVAQQGLDQLADGPIQIVPGNEAGIKHMAQLPRAEAVTLMHQAMAQMRPA